MAIKILLLEDDVFLREGLCDLLKKEGYEINSASTVGEAKQYLERSSYHLLIFDVMLPDGSGISLCEEIRESGNNVPILFLTAYDDEIQIVRGLDAGGDDYVTKPFKLLELLSRVRALLRRNHASVLKAGNIAVDVDKMSVKKDGKNIFVTPTEFQILSVLIRNSGSVVTRAGLLQSIWDEGGNFIDDNTLSVHISRLRDKIGSSHIKTIRGIGYRWEENYERS